MSFDDIRASIFEDFQNAPKPLTKEDAMVFVRTRLQDYPKQLQEFGDWFDKNSDLVIMTASNVNSTTLNYDKLKTTIDTNWLSSIAVFREILREKGQLPGFVDAWFLTLL